MVEVTEKSDSISCLLDYFSYWTRLKKAVAWILHLEQILMDHSKERKRLQTDLFCFETDPYQQEMTINQEMQKFESTVRKDLLSLGELEKAEIEVIQLSQKKRDFRRN